MFHLAERGGVLGSHLGTICNPEGFVKGPMGGCNRTASLSPAALANVFT